MGRCRVAYLVSCTRARPQGIVEPSKTSLVQMTPRRLHILIKYTVTLNDRFNLKVTLPLPRVLTVTFKVLALFGHLLGIKFSLGPFAPSLKFDKSQKSTKERMIIARNPFTCSLMTLGGNWGAKGSC